MQQPTTALAILFTDIVGSTRLWEKDPDWMGSVMARHDRLLATSVVAAGGRLVKGLGDGVLATFPTSRDAARAAIEAQRQLWPDPPRGLGLKVRMAVNFGEVRERDGDVFGPAVIQCSRLVGSAHGGQILLADNAVRNLRDDQVGLVDLGVHHLRDLADPIRVHQILVDDLPRVFPPLRTLYAFSHNLPTRLASFVGRERELLTVSSLLTDHRLVTLTGAGGSGKTRLALQVGADTLDRFADGTWLVNLLKVKDSDVVAETVAADLGIATDVGVPPTDAIIESLTGLDTLLIVDNCEHVLDATVSMIAALLEGTDRLRILATSREPLRIEGERIYLVQPLVVPERTETDPSTINACSSVQLFVGRVTDAGLDSRIAGHEALVGEIVRQLDGLPLAIELAAGRTRYMSLSELSKALARSFDVLRQASSHDRRHETIRSTIGWSYDLLTSDERLLLERLTIFHNGWYRDEAVAVCSGPPLSASTVEALLESLVDRSLVSTHDLEAGVTRFRLLEQVRQFAAERLDQAILEELRVRLVDYFVDFFFRHGNSTLEPMPVGQSDGVIEWMAPMIEDISNLVFAIETALDLDRPIDGLSILANGAWEVFYVQSGYVSHYYSWLDRALDDVTAADPMVALGAIEGAGFCASATTRPERMVDLHSEGLRRAIELGAEFVEFDARVGLGIGLIRTGRREEATRMLQEAVALTEGRFPVLALEARLWIALECETGQQAYERTKQLLAAAEELGDTLNTSFMKWFFAWEAMDRGQLDVALASVDRVLERPYHRMMPVVQCHLHDLRCRILARMGRQQEAEETLAEAFEATHRVIGPNWAVTGVWCGAADVAEYGGDRERALAYLSQGLEKARRGDIGLHIGMIGLRLIPYLLDDREVGVASDLLNEAKAALASVNRLDDFYLPLIELRRSQIAVASGHVGEAVARLAEAIPDDVDDPAHFALLIEQLEVTGLLLGSISEAAAWDVLAAVDRWNYEAGAVLNPVTIRRRRRMLGRSALTGDVQAPGLGEALRAARQALSALVSTV